MNDLLVRRVLFPLHERLKGKPTLRWLRELERTQWSSREEVMARQLDGLRRLVGHAYESVPYYRRLMMERNLLPSDLRDVNDLGRFPYLTREDLRRCSEDLRSRQAPSGAQRISTGGSTGAPVTVLVTMDQHGFAEAARLRAQRWFGLDVGAREVVLWGSSIELGRQTRWREMRDRLLNSRLLSAFDLGEAALARYTEVLHRVSPQKLYGYASALALLAGHMKQTGRLAGPGWPRAVFTTAEPLFDFQRRAIAEAFRCPVAVEYGARDAGLIAHECPAGRLHLNAEGILVEIAGDASPAGSGSGEIVVTNLLSHAMPLIRYRTGDVGALGTSPCECGRGLPVLERVEGRQTDFLVTTDGRLRHALSAIYVLREMPSIREFQIVQEEVNRICVNVVPDRGFTEDTRHVLASRLLSVFGEGARVEVRPVSMIQRPPSGKHRYVVSKVADERVRALLSPKPPQAEVAGVS